MFSFIFHNDLYITIRIVSKVAYIAMCNLLSLTHK